MSMLTTLLFVPATAAAAVVDGDVNFDYFTNDGYVDDNMI